MENKTWYIIGGIVVLLLLGWLVMRGFSGVAMNAAGVDVDRNLDGSATYSTEDGSVTIGSGSMPANWPSDAPGIFAGAAITFSGESNPQTGALGSVVMYNVNVSAQEVADYYKRELAARGWTVEGTMNASGTTVIGAKKDSRTFALSIVDTGVGSVQVTAGIEL